MLWERRSSFSLCQLNFLPTRIFITYLMYSCVSIYNNTYIGRRKNQVFFVDKKKPSHETNIQTITRVHEVAIAIFDEAEWAEKYNWATVERSFLFRVKARKKCHTNSQFEWYCSQALQSIWQKQMMKFSEYLATYDSNTSAQFCMRHIFNL